MPQDGNWLEWLASFEVIPPTKVGFSAARKIKFRGETAVFGFLPGLCSEILGQRFLFFSGPFLGKLCYVNLDSREKQEILPLKRKESGQKLVFLFSGENFVTPLWTFANNKRALPTNSTTADRLRLST